MKHIVLLLGVWIGLFLPISAQQMETFDRISADGYNYWLYSPDRVRNDSVTKPLVVFCMDKASVVVI